MYYQLSKRLFDVAASITILFILSPVIILLCILIRIFMGSPIFFKQSRPGLHEQPFYVYKFRTMLNAKNTAGHLLSDEDRLTPFGRLLRSSSLDELPELINVIKGDMSLVGPRPLLMEYLPYYSEEQRLRHSIRPGITGWAQINGRNTLSWKKKFEFDIDYVKHATFSVDIKILFLTIIKIIKREGISAAGHATMTRFDLESKHNSSL